MVPWLGVGFVVLISLMGFIDTRHTRRKLAKGLGAFSLLAAAIAAGSGVWLTLTKVPLEPMTLPILLGGPVLGGLVADALGDLRTRCFPAVVTIGAFALILPDSVGEEPTSGAVLFVAVICILLGSVSGALMRRVVAPILFRGDDEEEE
jgi:hypothetical protein